MLSALRGVVSRLVALPYMERGTSASHRHAVVLSAQERFWLICNQILIENERKLAWAGPDRMLVDLQSNSN